MGEILIDQLWRAAKSIPAAQKSTFPFIVDEFQRFVETNDNIADMLALARSYGIAFIGAHQFSGQLDKANKHIRPAMENNTGTKITFREDRDAENMADFFHPLKPIDIHSLGLHEVAMSVMTEQGKAPTVTGLTYPPPHPSGFGPAAREASRKNYGRPRAQVVAEIAARYKGLDEEREQTQVGRLPR
jgi:DNA helicase HerA-like ATPase